MIKASELEQTNKLLEQSNKIYELIIEYHANDNMSKSQFFDKMLILLEKMEVS